ncbi:MAG: GNAT family N-acetyltransferase [Tessaracoccus sp.]|uniref:GNAT family N-acetyltransferase n=1 Tax=Tessaracoccus sp. TaxID=1971211 RepID=UPI001EB55182|nr:GNAT family N-acetyltransferase [Tessaracoccus sp.]MBK7819657.1 GNAT family N-acetyltransferase [Tessaracoccus sp.]
MPYTAVDRVPTIAEHRQLADLVGWQDSFRWEAMAGSLEGSCCGTVVLDDDGAVVAMGRVVGDGAFFFYVQDVAVHPRHRRRGLGKLVVERLEAQVIALAGGTAFLGLFSTPEAESLYQGTGFEVRPGLAGMWQVLQAGLQQPEPLQE